MKQLKILWQFSRPHTIIGSVCSITALYMLANAGHPFDDHFSLLVLTLIAALGCNVFIVGLNQLVDVELDKINKPYLPLAAGTLSKPQARIIIFAALAICLITAAITSWFLLALMAVILLIGIAYSVPPLQLKKHHLPAAIAITLVRGFIVNIGIFLHFANEIFDVWTVPDFIWKLTLFIMAFSVAIAWFKDLPDTEGDAKHKVKTLAVLYSRRNALWGGAALVIAAYLYILVWSYQLADGEEMVLFKAHAALLAGFLLNLATVKLGNQQSVKYFYLRFWLFFFAEYIVFSLWTLQ
jgi:homogentisate phytyltransferase / homogentisate geranylgeranyltransferase